MAPASEGVDAHPSLGSSAAEERSRQDSQTNGAQETEKEPLGGHSSTDDVEKTAAAAEPASVQPVSDPNVIEWDGPNDPHNPLNWSTPRKWIIIALVSLITFNTSFASTIFAPGVPQLMTEFHSNNTSLASFVVSVYIVGFCLGPLVLAPLSELYGRSPVMHASNIFFIIFGVACAVSSDLSMFIVFRLLMGISGCPPLTLGGGTISDLMSVEKRGRGLGFWSMGPMMGPVLGPVVGGFMNQGVGWRWTFWLVVILHGVLTISSILVLRETYAPALIAKKVAQLRKESGNTKLRSKFDTGLTPRQIFTRAIVRPCKMLIRSPIVLMLALQMSIIYSYLYFLFTTFTFVFEDTYGFNSGESGLAYLGIGIGLFIGQQTVSHWSDWHLKKKTAAHGGEKKPEWRLPPLFPGGLLIPGGLIWYGWTAEFGVHWIVPILGTGLIGIGTNWAFLPIQMYLIDTFGLFAASALATNTVVRSLFGATLPLSSQPLYDRLGLGWGNTLLAFIALVLSPIPLFLMRYGERIRTSPRFAIKNL